MVEPGEALALAFNFLFSVGVATGKVGQDDTTL